VGAIVKVIEVMIIFTKWIVLPPGDIHSSFQASCPMDADGI
jgi:hypothetical protein